MFITNAIILLTETPTPRIYADLGGMCGTLPVVSLAKFLFRAGNGDEVALQNGHWFKTMNAVGN